MLRLWRTDPEVRYQGSVHEQIPNDTLARVAGDRRLLSAELNFLHDGFTGRAAAVKRQRDIQLIPWTVNEPEVMRQLKEWSVDALITDYPDIVLEVLREN